MGILHHNELIAILLRSGIPGKSAIELADEVLHLRDSLTKLSTISLAELMSIKGIKQAKALEILACFELSKRMALAEVEGKVQINRPVALMHWLNTQIGYLDQEHVFVVFLNYRNEIITYQDMFSGLENSCAVSVRQVYTQALRCNASKIMLVHNHPSGNVVPSLEDEKMTKRFVEVGKTCGIECLDHVIVGHNRYFSFKEQQMIES